MIKTINKMKMIYLIWEHSQRNNNQIISNKNNGCRKILIHSLNNKNKKHNKNILPNNLNKFNKPAVYWDYILNHNNHNKIKTEINYNQIINKISGNNHNKQNKTNGSNHNKHNKTSGNNHNKINCNNPNNHNKINGNNLNNHKMNNLVLLKQHKYKNKLKSMLYNLKL